jgi:putative transposase
MSRCVRQDFLLDKVKMSKGNSNYRQDWIQRRLLYLSDIFAIDLMSFAIMDNHTHLVLFANLELAKKWSNIEVLKRWSKLGKLPLLCQLYLSQSWRFRLNEVEVSIVLEQIDAYRAKLVNISVFMSRLNHYIAKRANKEDQVSGHFWEARFKSQALLDVNAVFACMAYVDLNPIRAKKVLTLEASRYTSIKYRLNRAKDYSKARVLSLNSRVSTDDQVDFLNLSLLNYIRALQGFIVSTEPIKVFAELNAFTKNTELWQKSISIFEEAFPLSAGEEELVSLFNKQARLFSNIKNREQSALANTILSRLLDYRYLFEKTRLCN